MTITTGASRRTRGQAILFMTMSLTTMLGMAGLVVDIGWGYWRKEAAQTAAASAASAAIAAASAGTACGSGWNCSTSYSCAASPSLPASNNLDNGCLYAKQNGFLNTGRQTVTLKSGSGAPPTTSGVAAAYYVVATITESQPTLFSAALGQSWMQITGQATAILLRGSGGGCVYVLDRTASGAWTQTGGNFTSGCGIYIDSNSPTALSLTGGLIGLSGGSDIDIVGNKTSSGGTIAFSAAARSRRDKP